VPASQSDERLELVVDDLRCPCCAEIVLDAVRGLPAVASARLDYQTGQLEAAFEPELVSPEEIRGAIRDVGYRLSTDPPGATTGQLAHGTQLAPIACGTKCDRMQYELPHTAAEREHRHPAEGPHAGRGGMDHDMSDPTMAVAMERDMRNRFFVALAFTIPVVLLSPLAVNTFGLELVGSRTARNWVMLVLSAPAVWYAGWLFIAGAYTSLRHRALNMSVLVATGVLAA
jgi:Cu2+-exporting ATPase